MDPAAELTFDGALATRSERALLESPERQSRVAALAARARGRLPLFGGARDRGPRPAPPGV